MPKPTTSAPASRLGAGQSRSCRHRPGFGPFNLDVDLQQRGLARLAEIDSDHVLLHLDIAADDLDQIALQPGQKIGRAAARALMRQHDLEALRGARRAVAVRREKQIEQTHYALPNNTRNKLRRSGLTKRISRCSPRNRATASR